MFSILGFARGATDYEDDRSIGSRLRARRIAPLLAEIDAVHRARGRVEVIDIGGTDAYWRIVPTAFLEQRQVRITIVNLPSVELPADHGPFSFVHGDGCALANFSDRSFDIAHSNSVLEHVGGWENMLRFARETRRVAHGYFVQTPNFWFPLEPHCMVPAFHWLPLPVRVRLLLSLPIGLWGKVASVDAAVRLAESVQLLTRTLFASLFPDAQIGDERLLFLTKSFVAMHLPCASRS